MLLEVGPADGFAMMQLCLVLGLSGFMPLRPKKGSTGLTRIRDAVVDLLAGWWNTALQSQFGFVGLSSGRLLRPGQAMLCQRVTAPGCCAKEAPVMKAARLCCAGGLAGCPFPAQERIVRVVFTAQASCFCSGIVSWSATAAARCGMSGISASVVLSGGWFSNCYHFLRGVCSVGAQ